MKKIYLIGLMIFSSTIFAASRECSEKLESLVYHSQEAARLYSAAIQHGFNIYTGEVDEVDDQSRVAKDYMRLSEQHYENVEILKTDIAENCLK